jgi:hypothetical protein
VQPGQVLGLRSKPYVSATAPPKRHLRLEGATMSAGHSSR